MKFTREGAFRIRAEKSSRSSWAKLHLIALRQPGRPRTFKNIFKWDNVLPCISIALVIKTQRPLEASGLLVISNLFNHSNHPSVGIDDACAWTVKIPAKNITSRQKYFSYTATDDRLVIALLNNPCSVIKMPSFLMQ